MGAIVNALYGTPLDTGIDPLSLARLSIYWEQVRPLLVTTLVNTVAAMSRPRRFQAVCC